MYKTQNKKGHRDRTSPERIARTTLEAEALRLRRDGHAFDEIAEMLGVEGKRREERVRYLVESALERKGKPDANAIRTDLLDRMDRVFNRAFRIAGQNGPDRVAALNAATNAAARIAALSGSDAPKVVDLKDDRAQPPVDATTAQKLVARLAQEALTDIANRGGDVDAATAQWAASQLPGPGLAAERSEGAASPGE